jgi:hypothetical protein
VHFRSTRPIDDIGFRSQPPSRTEWSNLSIYHVNGRGDAGDLPASSQSGALVLTSNRRAGEGIRSRRLQISSALRTITARLTFISCYSVR